MTFTSRASSFPVIPPPSRLSSPEILSQICKDTPHRVRVPILEAFTFGTESHCQRKSLPIYVSSYIFWYDLQLVSIKWRRFLAD